MPRGSTTIKRQRGSALQADAKNENLAGTVITGLKARKKKTNAHVNRHDKIFMSIPSAPPPLTTPPPDMENFIRPSIFHDGIKDIRMELGHVSVDSASSSDKSSELYQNTSGIPMNENHRHIDVNATNNPGVHRDLSLLSFALTILRSCPLSDTLAILIVLLQIPPTFLSMIHLLFATLTFVPSSVTGPGLGFTDILQGTTGEPSLTTILFLDLAVLLIWLFLWSPIQDIALDFAQAVIALTLGGGISDREASLKNILWCFGTIGASHIVRNSGVKDHGLSVFMRSNVSSTSEPDRQLNPSLRINRKRFGLLRSVLAIHILTQGVVRYIRDWYIRRENRDTMIKYGDPEVGKQIIDSGSGLALSQATENGQLIPTETEATNITSKNKKKNCAQVRTRQPLWAALASTKIIMVKEYENSYTAAELAGTNATDMNNLGNAPFNSEMDKIWITYVGSDEIFFSTSSFSTYMTNDVNQILASESSTVDEPWPFYIKVNNTIWKLTKIYASKNSDRTPGSGKRWSGEISGLAPTSNYDCDFISTVDKSILFSTSIRTLQSPTTDIRNPSDNKIGDRSGSPSSTLKASIAQAGKKLEEDRQRQKNSRKEQRVKLNSARREFDRLISNVSSTGCNDEKLRQKLQQSTLHMKQADEAAAALVSQIEAIENVPNDKKSLYSESRSEILSQREKHKKFCSEFSSRKQIIEQELQSLRSELSSLQQKLETRKQRLSILNSKHEYIIDANAKGEDEEQRKECERKEKRRERANMKAFYNERLHSITAQIYEGQAAINTATTAIKISLQIQQDMYQKHSPTSSQNLNGFGDSMTFNLGSKTSNYPWNSTITHVNAKSGCGLSPVLSMATSSFKPDNRTKGCSLSVISDLSKFTQSSDDEPLMNFAS